MKNIFKNLLFALIGAFAACKDLDIPPVNILTDKDVFSTEAGVSAYMIPIYAKLPIEDFRYNWSDGFNAFPAFPSLGLFTGELLQVDYVYRGSIESGSFGYWPYADIRKVNYFLENLPKNSLNFTSEQVNNFLGEAHFLRAYFYFDLVKRYGGVPVIKVAQDPYASTSKELMVPRSKEQEVYDFIKSDLDSAILLMPDVSMDATVRGRANKYVAAALKSRAMLYAGSIAKYGTMQLDGLLGIPSSSADGYFQQSIEAANLLAGKYSLYRNNADKYLNYVNLFLDKDSHENIFTKDYKYPDITHSWDGLNIPKQFAGNSYGSLLNPTLDYVELYGSLQVNDLQGNPIRFPNRAALFQNVEPRLRASVILPGDQYRNEVIDVQRGIYPSYHNGDEAYNRSVLKTSGNEDALYNGKRIVGLSGVGNGATNTGFYVRKYQDPGKDISMIGLWNSDQQWIDIRYAEILLNKAEAALELSSPTLRADALAAINDIRDRAGAPLLTNEQLNLEVVRNERRKELAFENQTWWDIRRWRTADKELNNRIYKALFPYYIFDEKQYIFKKEDELRLSRFTFQIRFYYEPIPGGEINKNPILIQNPLY
ncbi:Starch-binding associating with outer membrane [bacterium A37T11]|nr:Starch-binding associating with outer membrane [bacterium A37T11]